MITHAFAFAIVFVFVPCVIPSLEEIFAQV